MNWRAGILFCALLLFVTSHSAEAASPCTTTFSNPPVLITIDKDNNLGQLALVVAGGFRIFKDGCYAFPQAFERGTLNFRAFYVPDAADAQDDFVDYLGVKLIRILLQDGNPDQVKAYRNSGWYRTTDAGQKLSLDKTPDEPVEGGIEAWNLLHSQSELPWADYDKVIGIPWHAQLSDSRSGRSPTYAGLWITRLPDLGEDYRHIVSNQLIRFSASSHLVPFKGKVYNGTEYIIVRYYFGQDPNVHQVIFCLRSCT